MSNPPAKNHPWRKSAPRWTHNVQIVRIAFPPFLDHTHHKKLVAFDKDLRELLAKHDLPSEPSYIGFYRANSDWDNIDTPDSCIAGPNRGSNTKELDNEP